jgi:tRNA(Ile)-lysidine synthase
MSFMQTPFADNPGVRRFYWRWAKALLACLPESAPRILCALSGGCDSMLLATLLREAQGRGLCALSLGHVNHRLRPEADREEAFVRRAADAWGLGLQVERIEGASARARAEGISLEQAARRLRLQALARMARAAGCRLIALGHHMDDQAETVLLRILRGTGPGGLGAMAARDPLPLSGTEGGDGGELWLIRPLLGFRRAEVREAAEEAHLTWVEDPSNRDPAFLRNRVRHELLPQLAAGFNPRIVEGLADLAAWQRAADAVIGSLATTALQRARGDSRPGGLTLAAARLAAEPEAVATRVLWLAYQELAGDEAVLASQHMRQLLKLLAEAQGAVPGAAGPAAQVHLPGRVRAVRTKEWLRFEFRDSGEGSPCPEPGGAQAPEASTPPRTPPRKA